MVVNSNEVVVSHSPKSIDSSTTSKLFSVVAHIFFQATSEARAGNGPPSATQIERLLEGKSRDDNCRDFSKMMDVGMLAESKSVISTLRIPANLDLLARGFLIFWPRSLRGEEDDTAVGILATENIFTLQCEDITHIMFARLHLPQLPDHPKTFVETHIPAFFRLIGRVDDSNKTKSCLEIYTQPGMPKLTRYSTANPVRTNKKLYASVSANIESRTAGEISICTIFLFCNLCFVYI